MAIAPNWPISVQLGAIAVRRNLFEETIGEITNAPDCWCGLRIAEGASAATTHELAARVLSLRL